MDTDIYFVVMLVDDAYHFLIAVACRNAHKSAKFADTEVHMNNEVAWFHLLKFLHCERHLACSGAVAFEIVLMVAVKYLMIGKETKLQSIVGKAFMQCSVDRFECN